MNSAKLQDSTHLKSNLKILKEGTGISERQELSHQTNLDLQSVLV